MRRLFEAVRATVAWAVLLGVLTAAQGCGKDPLGPRNDGGTPGGGNCVLVDGVLLCS
jgi:hypothetical protein